MSKKGKLVFGIAVAVAWIIVLTLAAIFVVPRLLDHWSDTEPTATTQPAPADAEETVRLVLQGVVDGGTEMPVLLGADGKPVPMAAPTGIAGLICRKLTYEIEAVNTEETIATAQLRITAPDAVALVTQAVSGMDSLDETLLTQNMEQLLAGSFATVEFYLEVQLVQVEGSWCLVPNDQWSDAITGGLISRYTQLQLAILEALAGGADQ